MPSSGEGGEARHREIGLTSKSLDLFGIRGNIAYMNELMGERYYSRNDLTKSFQIMPVFQLECLLRSSALMNLGLTRVAIQG